MLGHYNFHGEDGKPDPLIMNERFVAAYVPGRGVTVLSACSHAGIVNACLQAKQTFPDTAIDAMLGGYHLGDKSMETRIDATVCDFKAQIDSRLVVPGHCTGWRAKGRARRRFLTRTICAPSVVARSIG